MRALRRVRTALLRLTELGSAHDSAVLLNPLSAFFDKDRPEEVSDQSGDPSFSVWLMQAPDYLDKLQTLLDELESRQTTRGRRFGSPDRVWIPCLVWNSSPMRTASILQARRLKAAVRKKEARARRRSRPCQPSGRRS